MPTLPRWGARLLYTFLIGQTDEEGESIPRESIEDALVDLFERLKAGLGGVTKIKPFEAVGDTASWGTEPTTVVVVLTELGHERTADSIIAAEARRLRLDLRQEQVWVTKQTLHLYIAEPGRD